jgi:hypothetical protein
MPPTLEDLVKHELSSVSVASQSGLLATAKIVAGLTYLKASGLSEQAMSEGIDNMRDLAAALCLEILGDSPDRAVRDARATLHAIRQEFGADH